LVKGYSLQAIVEAVHRTHRPQSPLPALVFPVHFPELIRQIRSPYARQNV
jgi:hypothetical protein